MATYAAGTEVSVSKSYEEIRHTLARFGASAFGFAEEGRDVTISFKVKGYHVEMRMKLPDKETFAINSYGERRPQTAIDKDWGAACRQVWRVMALGIKAKMAMVEAGFHTLEQEFLADVVTSSGATVGELVVPELDRVVRFAQLPALDGRGVIALGEGS